MMVPRNLTGRKGVAEVDQKKKKKKWVSVMCQPPHSLGYTLTGSSG